MPVAVRCPNASCGQGLLLPDGFSGTQSCPHCGQAFRLATPAPAAAARARAPATLDLPANGAVKPDAAATRSLSPETSQPAASRTPPPQVPERVGRFVIRRFLGEGAFGRVYEAYDAQLDRAIALKVAKPELMQSEQRVKRFLREAKSAANLRHPHIVPVFDSGTDAGHFYIANAFIPGRSLDKHLEELPGGQVQDFRKSAQIVRRLAEALAYAHQRKVVHRDVKPANVMLDEMGEPLLMDFGLAARDEGGEKLTQEGAKGMGTPAYMAPEQGAGEAVAASDQYSLGCTLFELLTGQTPFAGPPELQMFLHQSQEPVRPRKVNGKVPLDLDTICLKCLEKEPAKRYADCQALADDLRRWLDGEPVTARRPGPVERLAKWARRSPAVASLSLAVAVVLVVGAAAATIFAIRATKAAAAEAQQRTDAELQRDRARTAEAQANEARETELRQLYAADMLLASRAVTDGPLSRAIDLLDAWLPERRDGKEYRGREWHMLRRLSDTSEKTLIGHDGPLRALAWTMDGKLVASGGADRIIRVWDAETGQCLRTLVGHSAGIFDVAFSPDGKLLASAAADGTVRLWDADSGKERHVLRGHILPVYAVAFHPDGKRLASAGGDTIIKVWDATSGTELFALQGHEAAIGRLQFDAAGKRLASCGIIRGTNFWDLETQKVVDGLKQNGDVVFTPDLATGIFAYPAGTIGVVDVKEKEVEQGGFGINGIHAIDMNGSARIAAISGSDDTIRVIDRDTSSTLVTHRGHIGPARRVLLRFDARKLASAGDDGTVRIWSVPDPNEPKPYSGHHEHNVTAAAFSQEGTLLASGDYLGSIAVWNSQTGKRELKLGLHYLRRKLDVKHLEIGTGKPVVAGIPIKNKTVFSASATNKNPIVEVLVSQGHGGEVKGVAFTPDKKVLVSAGAQDLIIWDLESRKPIKEYEHPTLVSSLAVSPDGTLAATGCWDDIVRIFRVPSGGLVKQLEGHGDDVMCVAFHPNGKELATGSRDQTLIVWDLDTGKIKHRLRHHVNTVSAVRYTPDGKWLVSGGMDKAIHVWNAETGNYQSTLHGHNEGVTSLAFSADGKWLVSASDGTDDTNARIWLWDDGRFREGALLESFGGKGPTALAVHPVTGDVLMGRSQLAAFETKPFVEAQKSTAEPVAPEVLRANALGDGRLKVLGYAFAEEIAAWPDSDKGRLKPRPGGKFLIIAASLPFSRLKLSDADYRKLLELKNKDPDAAEPLKFSTMLIYPKQFVLSGGEGKPLRAHFVSRMAKSQQEGFEFMQKGVSLLEKMTATPQLDERQHVYLGWEIAGDFSAKNLLLRFENDEPVAVPSLELETFRPGKPFHPGSRSFDAGEGGNRLRSNVSRSPGP